MTSQILTISWIFERVCAKNLAATLSFVDFSKAFDSIHGRKMEQILPAYGFPKETVAAIMMLDKNTKVKVQSLDGDTDYFDTVAGVLQGDTLAPKLFIITLDCASNVYRFDERKRLYVGIGKKQKIPCRNYYGRGLCWWHSASGKYTRPSQIPAT